MLWFNFFKNKITSWHCRPCHRLLQVNFSKWLNIKEYLWLSPPFCEFFLTGFFQGSGGTAAPSALLRNSGCMNHRLPAPSCPSSLYAPERQMLVSQESTGSAPLASPSPFPGGRSGCGCEGSDQTRPQNRLQLIWTVCNYEELMRILGLFRRTALPSSCLHFLLPIFYYNQIMC